MNPRRVFVSYEVCTPPYTLGSDRHLPPEWRIGDLATSVLALFTLASVLLFDQSAWVCVSWQLGSGNQRGGYGRRNGSHIMLRNQSPYLRAAPWIGCTTYLVRYIRTHICASHMSYATNEQVVMVDGQSRPQHSAAGQPWLGVQRESGPCEVRRAIGNVL